MLNANLTVLSLCACGIQAMGLLIGPQIISSNSVSDSVQLFNSDYENPTQRETPRKSTYQSERYFTVMRELNNFNKKYFGPKSHRVSPNSGKKYVGIRLH